MTLIVILFAPLAELVPLAVISGMLVVIGFELILARIPDSKLLQLVKNEDGRWEERDMPEKFAGNDITVVTFEGFEFYAEVPVLAAMMPSVRDLSGAVIILRLRGSEMIHSTGIKWLETLTKELQEGGNEVLLAGVQPHLLKAFRKTEFDKLIGKDNIFAAQPGIGASLDAAWAAAQTRVAKE